MRHPAQPVANGVSKAAESKGADKPEPWHNRSPRSVRRPRRSPANRRRRTHQSLAVGEAYRPGEGYQSGSTGWNGSGRAHRQTRRGNRHARGCGSAVVFAQPIVAAAPAAAQPSILGPSILKAEEVTPTKLRQTIARRMVASKQTVPHFYVTSEIDMAEAMALRAKLNTLVDEAGKISVNDMVLKAAALALTRFPGINASFGENVIVRHGTVNMGIAVALEQGLITVVVADADRKPLAQIAREAKDIVNRAKNGKARPEELQGSTFTISNLGMFDVDEFVAIINPPEAAILAVGSAREVPVVTQRAGRARQDDESHHLGRSSRDRRRRSGEVPAGSEEESGRAAETACLRLDVGGCTTRPTLLRGAKT